MTRYLSGLCVAGLGLCGGGWLIVATEAFGGAGAGGAGRVNLVTGAALILASLVALVAWALAWRRRMHMDGVLGRRFLLVSRREARRNRRELARDIRRATRLARRASRQARRGARRPARYAGDAHSKRRFDAIRRAITLASGGSPKRTQTSKASSLIGGGSTESCNCTSTSGKRRTNFEISGAT